MSAPLFNVGDPVRVIEAYPPSPPTHIRTPFYIRGKTGTVERICGAFPNPEELAFGRDGLPERVLYRVRFPQSEVWDGYDGPAADHIEIEIYEFWLEAA